MLKQPGAELQRFSEIHCLFLSKASLEYVVPGKKVLPSRAA